MRSPHFLACRRAARGYEDVVVGLSGGPDSLALTAALVAEGARVEAVVIDHQLQPGSAQVAERAAAQARELGAAANIRKVQVSTRNLEAEARTARYAALIDAAGDRPVLVAHTLDDQAETLLLAALRGNPGGMAVRNGQIHRPFLGIRRADTVGACAELGLAYWEDPHNQDRAFRRVAVRQQVLPLLGEIIGGDAVAPLAQAAARTAADNALLDELAGPATDDCAELGAQPEPLRRRRIAAWLRAEGLAVTGAVVTGVDKLVSDWHGQGGVAAGYAAGRRLDVRRIGGKLTVIPQEP